MIRMNNNKIRTRVVLVHTAIIQQRKTIIRNLIRPQLSFGKKIYYFFIFFGDEGRLGVRGYIFNDDDNNNNNNGEVIIPYGRSN